MEFFVNMLTKNIMVLTAALMVSTSCFAMGSDSDNPYTPTAREKSREETTTTTTTLSIEGIDWPKLEEDCSDVARGLIHPLFVGIAEADKEDFKNMLLVSTRFFRSLTGTGEFQGANYPNYTYLIKGQDGVDNYVSSEYLQKVHRIKFSPQMSLAKFCKLRVGRGQIPDSLSCQFPYPQALTHLDLSRNNVDFMGKNSLAQFINLESFSISQAVSTQELGWLSGLEALPKLKHFYVDEFSGDKNYLSGLTSLETLSISRCALGVLPGLEHLQDLYKLKVFDLSNNSLDKADPKFFSGFTDLAVLNLSRCFLNSGDCLIQLPQPHKIKILNLTENDLHSTDPEFLLTFTELEDLNLSNCKLAGPQWLSALAKGTQLKKLNLGHNDLTNVNEVNFSEFPKLEYLDIAYNAIENFPLLPEGLRVLAIDPNAVKNHYDQLPLSLTELHIMNAKNNPLTDKEILSLTRLTNLKELVLDMQVSDEIEKELKEKLPEAMIDGRK
jgi:hypothetical protein